MRTGTREVGTREVVADVREFGYIFCCVDIFLTTLDVILMMFMLYFWCIWRYVCIYGRCGHYNTIIMSFLHSFCYFIVYIYELRGLCI
jgi:hypothetical protein